MSIEGSPQGGARAALEGEPAPRGGSDDRLPEGVLVARLGAGANCSSAGSAIDILFYTSVIAGAIAVALSAAFPPRDDERAREGGGPGDRGGSGGASADDPRDELR